MSERDVIYCLRNHGAEVLDWPVARVMSSPAITADSRTEVLSALALMTQRRIRHLPVVEDGQIRGIVSIGDLVKHRMERIEAEAEAMRAYIQSA
jgi:signal-transduction protein with cAMP-binding, CBS, and nucleotidyltransferase domain